MQPCRRSAASGFDSYATAFLYPGTLGALFPSVAEVTTAIDHAQPICDFVLKQVPPEAHPA